MASYFDGFLLVRGPAEVWETEPSLLAVEVAFFFMFFCLVVHAQERGGRFVVLLLSTLVAGWPIEFLTLYNHELDNIWHAQAMLMVFWGKEPIWMLMLYGWTFYTPIAVVWGAGKLWSAPLLAALTATLAFYPVDIVGPQYLWWTWHNSDPFFENRDRGMPFASPLWIMCFTCGLTIAPQLLEATVGATKSLLLMPVRALVLGVVSNLIMQIFMTAFYYAPKAMYETMPDEENWTFQDGYKLFKLVCVAIGALELIILALMGRLRLSATRALFGDASLLMLATSVAMVCMIGTGILAKSEEVRATGLHQTFGDCDEKESCFWGQHERYKYICEDPASFKQVAGFHNLECLSEAPEAGQTWYTWCGMAKHPTWIGRLVLDVSLGLSFFALMSAIQVKTVASSKAVTKKTKAQ